MSDISKIQFDFNINMQVIVGLFNIFYVARLPLYLSHHMGKPTICIGENKGADQLRSNCEADQRLCFRYSDSTIPLLLKSETSLYLFPVLVQVGLCRTCSETTLLIFPRGGSFVRDLTSFCSKKLGNMLLGPKLIVS